MHPGDPEPLLDELLELGGDVMGAVVGAFGSRLAPVFSAPAEAMSALAVFDLFPKLRQGIEDRLGHQRTELVLSLAGAVLGAAAQTPVSALADASLRAVELPAALARRRVWRNRAIELASRRMLAKAEPLPPTESRLTALPDGPVEEYARKARRAAGVAARVLLPVAGPLVAARAVAIAAPKAARMSVDAYAAELGRILASPVDGHAGVAAVSLGVGLGLRVRRPGMRLSTASAPPPEKPMPSDTAASTRTYS